MSESAEAALSQGVEGVDAEIDDEDGVPDV